MRPVREDQRHRRRSDARSSRDGNYLFEFCSLHAAYAWKSLSEKKPFCYSFERKRNGMGKQNL